MRSSREGVNLGHVVKLKMLGLAEGLIVWCDTEGKLRVISGFLAEQLSECSAIYKDRELLQ